VACNILLESSWWGLQLSNIPHLNQRFSHKVMGPQSCGSPNFGNTGTKWHLGACPIARHKVCYKGEGDGFPKFGLCWVLWVRVCLWLIRAPKCSNYALTNLLFGLCRHVWVIKLLVNLPNPIPELQHALLPPKCYESGSAPQLLLLLFSPSDS
jgi:hypothetical protein